MKDEFKAAAEPPCGFELILHPSAFILLLL